MQEQSSSIVVQFASLALASTYQDIEAMDIG